MHGGSAVSFISEFDSEINPSVWSVKFAHTTAVSALCQMQLSATVSRAEESLTSKLGDTKLNPSCRLLNGMV